MSLSEYAEAQRVRRTREIALQAAAASWAGISAIRDRDASILATAGKFEAWLNKEPQIVELENS